MKRRGRNRKVATSGGTTVERDEFVEVVMAAAESYVDTCARAERAPRHAEFAVVLFSLMQEKDWLRQSAGEQ